MNTRLPLQAAFHRGMSLLFDILTPEQLQRMAEVQADENLAPRIEYLSQRANEGELTDFERGEYEGYLEANNLLSIIQSEARLRLSESDV
jgi:hypothetical protein